LPNWLTALLFWEFKQKSVVKPDFGQRPEIQQVAHVGNSSAYVFFPLGSERRYGASGDNTVLTAGSQK
jgi:hypothetical protein